MMHYEVNPEKRTVVAVLKLEESGRKFIGKAKCSESDQFDEEIGRRIAHHRAVMAHKAYQIDRLLRYKKHCYHTIDMIENKITKCRNRIYNLKTNMPV